MHLKSEEIIEGIRNNDRKVLIWIYRISYRMVEKLVRSNGGNRDEARDVFQDAILVLQRKVKTEGFVLTCSVSSFIYGVSKNIWRRKRTELDLFEFKSSFEEDIDPDTELFMESIFEVEQIQLMHHYFNELKKECKELLMYYINGLTFTEISKAMEIKRVAGIRLMFFRCKKNLIEMIMNDPRYKDLSNE